MSNGLRGMLIVEENEEFFSLEVKKECAANSVNVTLRPSKVGAGKYLLDLATNTYNLKCHLIGGSFLSCSLTATPIC